MRKWTWMGAAALISTSACARLVCTPVLRLKVLTLIRRRFLTIGRRMNPELAKNDIAFAFDEIVGGNWMVRDDKALSIEALIRIYKELLARGPGLFETWLSHLEDFTVRRLDSAVKIQAHARGKLGRAKAGKRKAARLLEELQRGDPDKQ